MAKAKKIVRRGRRLSLTKKIARVWSKLLRSRWVHLFLVVSHTVLVVIGIIKYT
jgi:hypothetical protein